MDPKRAVESVLTENKIIGLAWAVIDYMDPNSTGNNGFWNLSRHHRFFGNADYLCPFKLMPLEPQFLKALDAKWTFTIVDMDRRLVAFKDQSTGKIASWKWDFGDGETSAEQNPIHTYSRAGAFTVVLTVTGADGATSRFSRVWDVTLK
jgi:PKD repeat protein